MSSNYKDHLYALILAGGGGTRLWPRSRNKTPKQFLKLFNGKTLIQITAKRLRKLLPWSNIYIVTVSNDYRREIIKQVPQINKDNIIVEPARKNTAPAHGLGAAYIYMKDREAVIINAASDHFLKPVSMYMKASFAAAEVAFSGDWLVALGIRPTYANVGYGHIKRGEKFGKYGGKFVYKIDKFIEKPPLDLAKRFTKAGNYYWNANQYVWRADTYLNALKKNEPKVGQAIDTILEVIGTNKEEAVVRREYQNMPDTTKQGKDLSVDYAVSEKADNFLVIPVKYNWTDIGDWNEVWKNLKKDDLGNVIIDGEESGGEVINLDTSDAIVHKDGRLIALIDVDNIVIIDTKDALLVCAKSKAQNVKKIVKQLKKDKKKQFL